MTEIQLRGPLLIDGTPAACPTCGAVDGLTFTVSRIPIATWPAWVTCPAGHGEDSDHATNAMVAAALQARTGRTVATDVDTFRAVLDDGRVIEGELAFEWVMDDLRQGAKAIYRRAYRPWAKRQLRKGRRAAGAAVKQAAGTVAETAIYTPFAAGLGTAWNARTGIADPAKANPCRTCKGKGAFRLDTRFHDSPTVPCSMCAGTGNAAI